jgi:hypothetical protein
MTSTVAVEQREELFVYFLTAARLGRLPEGVKLPRDRTSGSDDRRRASPPDPRETPPRKDANKTRETDPPLTLSRRLNEYRPDSARS